MAAREKKAGAPTHQEKVYKNISTIFRVSLFHVMGDGRIKCAGMWEMGLGHGTVARKKYGATLPSRHLLEDGERGVVGKRMTVL